MEDRLTQLRDMIPDFECKPGCHACCAVVPWSQEEIGRARIDQPVKSVSIVPAINEPCSLLRDTGCSVYAQRPIMCRLFGTVEDLRCPEGFGPGALLSKTEAADILKIYIETFMIKKGGSSHATPRRPY